MISWELIAPFFAFVIITCFMPGPNAMVAMTSGNLFGWRRTLPFILGAETGFVTMLIAVIFGLDIMLAQMPWLTMTIRILGACWLAWYGWKFLRLIFVRDDLLLSENRKSQVRALRFHEAFLLQWINPKGLIVASSSAGSFIQISSSPILRALIMGLLFFCVGVVAFLAWASAGSSLSVVLKTGRFARLISAIMGALLIFIAIGLLFM